MNYECVEVPFLHSNLGLLTLDIFFNRKVRKDLRKGRKVFFCHEPARREAGYTNYLEFL